MSYVLRRPMFRKGGSADDDGITSGLRPGYKDGETVEEQFLRTRDLLNKYNPPRRSNMNDFLINFGLNMASQPPSGNIFQTAAAQARGPFQAFQSSRGAQDLEQKKLNAAMIGDIMAQRSEERIAGIEAGGKGSLKETQIEEQQIKQAFKDLSDLRKARDETTDVEELRVIEYKIKGTKGVLTEILGIPPEYEAIIGNDDSFENFIEIAVNEENKKRIDEFKTNNPDATTVDVDENVERVDNDSVEAIDLTFKFLKKKYGYQSGGRVSKQMGGPMVEEQMRETVNTPQGSATIQDTMIEGAPQNPNSPVQNLSYDELRARLPREISDEIVKLLSESEQALIDFASIQTQQDVDAFNQKYQVELVLPAEA